MKQQTLNA